MKLSRSKLKAIGKTITWRIIASATTFMLAMMFFGDDPNATKKAAGIAVIETIIKMLLYYYHEILWQKLPLRLKLKRLRKKKVGTGVIITDRAYRNAMRERRLKFIETHRELIEKAKAEESHKGHHARQMLKLARVEIGYSSNTASQDIYTTLTLSVE